MTHPIILAMVEHSRDKSLIEGSVKNASTWILAALRDYHLFSIDEARQIALEKLGERNNKPFKKRQGCRLSAYLAEEREFIKPLPTDPYERAIWSSDILNIVHC